MEAVISKRFNDKTLFKDFALSIPDNGITLLKGKSGSGKTTLLRILAGLETLDSGDISSFANKKCAFVFQEPRLIEHFSATNNLLLVNKDVYKVKKLLKEAGLDAEDSTPVSKYSGGEKARVAILRALLSDADFFLFDEPFNGLDDKNKKNMSEIIKREIKDKLAIFVTHVNEDLENLQVKKIIEVDK